MSATSNFLNKNSKQLVITSATLGLLILIGTGIYAFRQSKADSANQPVTPVVPEKANTTSVSALGRIEPQGEVIQVSSSPSIAGAKVKTLLVQEGDEIKKGDIIAITTDYDTEEAKMQRAEKEVKIAQANLAIVKAGAKEGEINAQKATIERLKAELEAQKDMDRAKINRLTAQLTTQKKEKQANIQRLQAELDNARSDWQRYQQLAEEGVISASDLDKRKLDVATANESLAEAQASYQMTVSTINEEILEAKAESLQNDSTLGKEIIEAQARLDEISEVRDVDVTKAEAELEQAIAFLKQSQVDLELTQIKAPIDGEILD